MTEPLKCPKCGTGMTEAQEKGFSIDVCTSCRGLWIDSFSLDAILAKKASARYATGAQDLMNPASSEPTRLPCPRCPSSLSSNASAMASVDWCPGCRGLFLEGSAIEELERWRRQELKQEVAELSKGAAVTGAKAGVALGAGYVGALFLGGTFAAILAELIGSLTHSRRKREEESSARLALGGERPPDPD